MIDQLKDNFKEWLKQREKCLFRAQYCLLIGTPCSYVHCLFRTDIWSLCVNIPCPVCHQNIKYPIQTKCEQCGYDLDLKTVSAVGGEQ